jgi:hypothetical protein
MSQVQFRRGQAVGKSRVGRSPARIGPHRCDLARTTPEDIFRNVCFVVGPSKTEPDAPRASVIRATTDSPMSPPPLTSINPPVTKQSTSRSSGIYSAPRTLFDMFTSQEKVKSRQEFSGRLTGSGSAKLYASHKYGDSGSRGDGMEVE